MKIGIYGGTFDPIHKGHTESALAAMRELSLDRIIFVPCGEPPHKLNRRITDGRDRLEMVRRAVSVYDNMSVSDFELSEDRYSFSIDTVRHFRQKYGTETELYFIMGADSLASLPHWVEYQKLISLCKFAVLMRPGNSEEMFAADIEKNRKSGAEIFFVRTEPVDISSEELRTAIKSGELSKVRENILPAVYEYITEKKLYLTEPAFDEEYAKSNMQRRLKPERYLHSLRVSDEAIRIADMFGIDREKCRIAGLLHDCGKGITQEQLYWLAPELIEMTKPENGGSFAIVHGPAGAVIAEQKYGIIDKVILEAIRCHVTGEPGMCPEAQVVFIADYTEKGREGETFEKIRKALENAERSPRGLCGVVVTASEESMKYVMQKGQILSLISLATRNDFLIKAKGDTL